MQMIFSYSCPKHLLSTYYVLDIVTAAGRGAPGLGLE